jgi:formylglycine-generating enzyme required for sulfatase activity
MEFCDARSHHAGRGNLGMRHLLPIFFSMRQWRRATSRLFIASPKRFYVCFVLLIALGSAAVAGSETDRTQGEQTFRDCSDCPEMVVVPAGTFLMGSSLADTARDLEAVPRDEALYATRPFAFEHPQHLVSIKQPFGLGRYFVTRGEFSVFVQETKYLITGKCTIFADHRYERDRTDSGWQNPGFAQSERDPVVCVSWQDAQAYVAWLNSKMRSSSAGEGPYRLPTESEWEYAARAGTRTSRWWGDSVGLDNAVCDGCGSFWDREKTSPVGSFSPNKFGLYDMLGNAWEWTQDCWHETYAGAPADGGAWMSGPCGAHVMRGGDWSNDPWVLRSAGRSESETEQRANYLGFRVGKTLQ